ncbi:hypothetical protein RO575_01035 [Methylomonas sp. MO1]|uniref:hypothetical protein n=1 Tax=unclassified Methylomonas TaxID=2608980 RepID=UPI00047BCF0D|nr:MULTISPECIES: hypothetical protein [unclassified Methylomonas]MDT4288132.1 hypothetical protein [Methylomonas sp. MO1]
MRNFFLVTLAIIFSVNAWGDINIVPIETVFNVKNAIYAGNDILKIENTEKTYVIKSIRADRKILDARFVVLSSVNSKIAYLMDESYVFYDKNVADLGDGRVILVLQSGGNHCCSAFVSLIKNEVSGELGLGGARMVDQPEGAILKDNLRLDSEGNIFIAVSGFTDHVEDDANGLRYYPNFRYFIKTSKDGGIAVDRNVGNYESIINGLKIQLSERYDFEKYIELIFINRLLALGLSEDFYLRNASENEVNFAQKQIKWFFEELNFFKSIDDNDFVIKKLTNKFGM